MTGPFVPVGILNPIRAVVGIPLHRFNLFVKCSSARKLKVTMVLDPAPFAALRIGDNAPPRTELTVTVGGRTVSADLATKSVRKAVKALAEHSVDGVALVLQGALTSNDRIEDAGITAQVKAPAPQAA